MQIDAFFSNQNRHVRYLLGLYISKRRNEANLSVDEVAAQTGVSSQTYRRIEAGRAKISSAHFEKLLVLLNLEHEDLIEIRKIAAVQFINDLSKTLVPDYPA